MESATEELSPAIREAIKATPGWPAEWKAITESCGVYPHMRKAWKQSRVMVKNHKHRAKEPATVAVEEDCEKCATMKTECAMWKRKYEESQRKLDNAHKVTKPDTRNDDWDARLLDYLREL